MDSAFLSISSRVAPYLAAKAWTLRPQGSGFLFLEGLDVGQEFFDGLQVVVVDHAAHRLFEDRPHPIVIRRQGLYIGVGASSDSAAAAALDWE